MNKNITFLVFGGIITAFCFHAYTVYQMRKSVIQQGIAITEIVGFINKTMAQNQPQTPVK